MQHACVCFGSKTHLGALPGLNRTPQANFILTTPLSYEGSEEFENESQTIYIIAKKQTKSF